LQFWRRYFPKSLYARVVLIVVLPIFLILALVTYVFFERHWDEVSANLSTNTAGQIALVTRLYEDAQGETAREKIFADALQDLDLSVRFDAGAQIPDKDKVSILNPYNRSLDKRLERRLGRPYWFNTRSWPGYVEVRVETEGGALVFMALRDRVFATSGPIFLAFFVGSSALLGWIAIIFMRNQVRSILRLGEAAEAFGRGREIPDFRPTGATEVRRAGYAFIAMRERIKRQIHQRTAMLAGISHDLRTPLTRMKLQLAMSPQTPDTQALKGDVDEMERMVDSYLNFVRDIAAGEEPEIVDVGALLKEAADDAQRAGRDLPVEAETDLVIAVRRDALKRAVQNLVTNGFKYATRVWVSGKRVANAVEIVVDDDGPGIDPAKYDEALKPFARLDEARNQNKPGVGLGLSVVRDVARIHGGDVVLGKAPQGGLRATIRIPA
jgi:two-component system osmolarity sensor histidine kinase EnvZ